MKQVIDETISKRPISVPDAGDIDKLQEEAERLRKSIAECDVQIDARKDERFVALLRSNVARMREIAFHAMTVDVRDTHLHAEMVGQLNERIKLANEIKEWENIRRNKESGLNEIVDRIKRWTERLKRK